MGAHDDLPVRGLTTGENDYAVRIVADVNTLRHELHTARSAMEGADEAAARLRAAGEALSITQGDEFVKIGYTKDNPEGRLISLQTGNPYKLELIKYIRGNADKEAEIQAKFSHLSVRNEWFYLTKELKAYIDGLKSNTIDMVDYMRVHERVMETSNRGRTHRAKK